MSEILKKYGLEPDPVIEAYKKDVDRTLLRENLKLTFDERMRKFLDFQKFVVELRKMGRKHRSQQKKDNE